MVSFVSAEELLRLRLSQNNVEVAEKFRLFIPPLLHLPDRVSGAEVCRGRKFFSPLNNDNSFVLYLPMTFSHTRLQDAFVECENFDISSFRLHERDSTVHGCWFHCTRLLLGERHYTHTFMWQRITLSLNSDSVERISLRHHSLVHKPLCIFFFLSHWSSGVEGEKKWLKDLSEKVVFHPFRLLICYLTCCTYVFYTHYWLVSKNRMTTVCNSKNNMTINIYNSEG